MMSSPARSWSRIAISVASSCASSRYCGSTRHSSVARTRGGKRPRRRSRSISQSGWAYEPTRLVGSASGTGVAAMARTLTHRRISAGRRRSVGSEPNDPRRNAPMKKMRKLIVSVAAAAVLATAALAGATAANADPIDNALRNGDVASAAASKPTGYDVMSMKAGLPDVSGSALPVLARPRGAHRRRAERLPRLHGRRVLVLAARGHAHRRGAERLPRLHRRRVLVRTRAGQRHVRRRLGRRLGRRTRGSSVRSSSPARPASPSWPSSSCVGRSRAAPSQAAADTRQTPPAASPEAAGIGAPQTGTVRAIA